MTFWCSSLRSGRELRKLLVNQSRASLHFTLILAGFGFRQGLLMRICYKHVRLFVVQDPYRPGERTLATTITVVHDKRHTVDPRSQKPGIAHSTYVLAYLVLWL